MDVVFAVVAFLDIGEVAIELGSALDDGIRAITEPLAIQSEKVSLVVEIADTGGVAEDVCAVAEDAVGLRRDEIVAMLPVAVGLKIPTRIMAILCFGPPLEFCGALCIGLSHEHQIL